MTLGVVPRLAIYYFVMFGFSGAYQPFFPVWLDSIGYSAAAISLLVGLPIMLRVPAAIAVGSVVDAFGDRRLTIIVMSVAATLISAVFLVSHSVVAVGIASCLLFVAFGITQPVADALANSGDAESRARFGQVRLWGTVSYGAAAIGVGWLITNAGAFVVPIWIIVILALRSAWALVLPRSPVETQASSGASAPERWFSGWPLVKQPVFVVFAVGIGLSQAAHAMLNSFGAIHWGSLGYSGTMIGVFWGLGIGAEVVFFYFSKPIFARFSPAALLFATCAVAAVRMAIMATDPPLPLLIVLQLSHGITFGAMALGLIHFVNKAVPDRLNASAHGLGQAIGTGIISALAFVASGPIYAALGAGGFLVMSAIALVGVGASLYVMARWDGGHIV